jgi:hypothetical protein
MTAWEAVRVRVSDALSPLGNVLMALDNAARGEYNPHMIPLGD